MPTQVPDGRGPGGSGLVAGAMAGAAAGAVMLVLAQITATPSLSESVAEAIAGLTPIALIEILTGAFGGGAKRGLFGAVILGETLVGGALGFVIAVRRLSGTQRVATVVLAATLTAVAGLPALGMGLLGAGTRAGTLGTLTSLTVGALAFMICFVGLYHYLNPTGLFAAEDAAARRAFLRKSALTIVGVIAGISAFRWAADRLTPELGDRGLSAETRATLAAISAAPDPIGALEAGIPGLSSEITPNDKFYVVSKNVVRDPEVNAGGWRLELAGAVDRPSVLTYEQLKALPAANQFLTLMCISNPVGGNLIGNADWRGVSLAALLRQAGVRASAVDVVLRAADDYSDSIPIAKAMDPATMLAYEMNGEVLPKEHGYPARLLVPDIYGMKNVKWVTKIEVVEFDYRGYWQERGWGDGAVMNTTARIDFPKPRSVLSPGANYVGGVALAGARGIQKVEISTDDGATWAPATVKAPLGPFTWVLWLYEWHLEPSAAPKYRVLVRATDGRGIPQVTEVRDEIPDGSTGLHAITVTAQA